MATEDEHCRHFYRDGFAIIKNVLSEEQTRVLRDECERLGDFLIDNGYDIMKDFGGIIVFGFSPSMEIPPCVEPLNVGYDDPPETQTFVFNKRAYIRNRDKISAPDSVVDILFGVVKDWAAKFLPRPTEDDQLCLFNEQYIVKSPRSPKDSAFVWHQDTQYMDKSAQEIYPIVSCWIALNDVGPENGTLLIEPLPFDGNTQKATENIPEIPAYLNRFSTRASAYSPPLDVQEALSRASLSSVTDTDEQQQLSEILMMQNEPSEDGNEHQQPWRYRTPILVQIPAGSVVFLSGHVRHCSLGNGSPMFRRAYMPQYSIGAVYGAAGNLISLAVPCEDPVPLQVPPVFEF